MIIVAHPDDEAVGCGALMQRMSSPSVLFMTDGAPQMREFWKPYGSRQNYATVRRFESKRALATFKDINVERFGAPDQELHRNLGNAREWLALMVERYRPDAILTHAYEGGHPDHDSCAFLSWAVGRAMNVPVWEMPLYRRMNGRLILQRFAESSNDKISLIANQAERDRKQKMISSYRSQLEFLMEFHVASESFRPQPAYDFGQPPHEGVLNYEAWEWGITGHDVCLAFREGLRWMPDKVAQSA